MQITAIAITRLIKYNKLGKKQFQALVVVQYDDMLYFCEVLWLCQGVMLSRVCDLHKEIAIFLRHKNLPCADQFFGPRWLARLALLMDNTTHLNALNVKLHGKDILVTDMHAYITAACVPDDVEPDICVSVVASLREEFASRFAGQAACCRLQAVYRPLTFPWTTPLPLQMELVELQCNDELKAKFYNSSPLSFFRDSALPSWTFPKYIAHVQRTIAMFGGTHCCEQLFSKMKYTKSRLRSLLSDSHLNDILLLSSSSIEPGIEILIHGKQHQPSHGFACFAIKVL